MLALKKKQKRGCCSTALHSCIMGGVKPALTVWLFNMNWTALSFTSFLTLLYVSKLKLRRKHRRYSTVVKQEN